MHHTGCSVSIILARIFSYTSFCMYFGVFDQHIESPAPYSFSNRWSISFVYKKWLKKLLFYEQDFVCKIFIMSYDLAVWFTLPCMKPTVSRQSRKKNIETSVLIIENIRAHWEFQEWTHNFSVWVDLINCPFETII